MKKESKGLPKTKQEHNRNRDPRKDAFYVDVQSMDIIEGFNPRIDYGDLDELAKIIGETPDKIPPLRGYKKGDRYVVIQGHRRRLAGLKAAEIYKKQIRLLILPEAKGYTDVERTVDFMLTNEGKKLNLLEQANVIQRLQSNYELHEKEISARIHKSVTYVRNCLSLLKAPADIQELMHDGLLSPTLVITLLKEMELDKAVQAIRDTIENMQSVKPTPAPKQEQEVNNGGEPDAADDDDRDLIEMEALGGIGNRLNPTDKGFTVAPFEDREAPLLMKSKISKKDIDQTLKKVNSVSIFKKLINHSASEVVKEERAEEFVFLQRIVEGNVTEEEMSERYFGKKNVDIADDDPVLF